MSSPSSLRGQRAWAYENARPELQALVPTGARRVLDLGCSSGVVGAALRARQGCEVVGIERDPAYAADAAARLDRVVEGDLDELFRDGAVSPELGVFDCLLAGDVLEHLRDPWAVLRVASALLTPDGVAVVSLPNVRYWETFWQLARHGSWPQRSEGIFDRSHLRFFTGRDGWALIEGAGLRVELVRRRYRLHPRGSRWERWAPLMGATPLRPLFVFQYLFRARPA